MIQNYLLTSENYTSSFHEQEVCEPNFTVKSFDRNANQLLLGGSLQITKMDRYTIDLAYEGRILDHSYVHSGTLKIDYPF